MRLCYSFIEYLTLCMLKYRTYIYTLPVFSFVPQGSKLGPLLFILYITDIINNFHYAKVRMYADVLTIYAVVNNFKDKEILQYELNKLENGLINSNLK